MLQRFAVLVRPRATTVTAARHSVSGAGACDAAVGLVASSCRAVGGRAMCSGLASPETQLKQAQLMTFDREGDAIKPRPVPQNAADFESARRAYKAEVRQRLCCCCRPWAPVTATLPVPPPHATGVSPPKAVQVTVGGPARSGGC